MDFKKLNNEQKKVITHNKGPVLIMAGAGTGKTAVLTNRFIYLAEKGKAKPEEILALTFTEKAAGEMEERIGELLPFGYMDLWVMTFHSFGEKVLRENGLDIGLNTDFKILDETSAWLLLRQNLDRFNLDYYKSRGNPGKFIKALISHFARCKDQEISPDDYLKYSSKENEDKEKIKELALSYKTYQTLLLEKGLLDFGDLINYTLELFRKRPKILEEYRKRFKYILVDEFQDTNWAQYELVKLLAKPENNLMVAADDDQSIYKFRGASFGNVLQFSKDYPKASKIVLIKNYRSFQNILDLAHKFIQRNNPNRLEYLNKINKNLKAQNQGRAEIEYLHFNNLDQEVEGVVLKIADIFKKDKKADYSDFAILVRANSYAERFCRAFERAGIPFQFLAQRGLYSKPIILDVISYFKLLDNYHESSAAYRIMNLPFLKIPLEDIVKITNYSAKRLKSVYEAWQEIVLIKDLSSLTSQKINKILSLSKKHSEAARQKNVSEIMLAFLEDFGYLEYLAKEQSREKINYLVQFHNKIKEFEEENLDPKLKNFMEKLNLELEAGEEGKLDFNIEQGPDMIKIMTYHSAKGLEFRYIFLVNLVAQRMPSIDRKEPIEIPLPLIKDIIPKGDAHLEEERRLFYVGMTRAKKGLYFTSARDYGGEREKKISMFLGELGYSDKILNPKSQIPNKSKIQNTKYKIQTTKYKFLLPDHFSFTQLVAFDTCPLQYKFAHILRIPVKGRATFSFGKTMHKTLFDLVSELLSRKVSFKEAVSIYDKNWLDEWYLNKKQRDSYYSLGIKSLEKFYKDFMIKKPEIYFINGKPALEQSFNFKIGNCKIKGKIDRIDKKEDKAEVIDYKTGSIKEKLKTEEKTQLLIYQMAAEKVFGITLEKLTYYYLDEGKTISFLGTEKDIKAEKERIIFRIEEIKNSDFKATPGRHCFWCDFNRICEFAEI